jgi:hypothetical protein
MLFSSSVVQQFIILNCVAITSSVVSFLAARSTYRGRSDIADTAYPSSNMVAIHGIKRGIDIVDFIVVVRKGKTMKSMSASKPSNYAQEPKCTHSPCG